MTVKGGTSQACAACKFQRRRCAADCQLAPYFPPDQPKLFQNAHRLFGVRNILRVIKKLQPAQKSEAMRSILYESYFRDKFPVHGCLGFISTLYYDIHHLQLELDNLNSHLALYRATTDCRSTSPVPTSCSSPPPLQPPSLLPAPPQLPLVNMNHSNHCNGLPLFHEDEVEKYYDDNYNAFNSSSFKIQDEGDNGVANNSTFIGSSSHATNAAAVQEMNEMCPYFGTAAIDDQQSYIESSSSESSLEGAIECWNETMESRNVPMESFNGSMESMKDTVEIMKGKMQLTEHVSENDLKSAAACFKLTSVH